MGSEQVRQGLGNTKLERLVSFGGSLGAGCFTYDHLPLFLNLNKKIYVPRGRRFHFENIWIRERDCMNVIKECYNKEGVSDIMLKLMHCCVKLEVWGGSLVKEMRMQRQKIVQIGTENEPTHLS